MGLGRQINNKIEETIEYKKVGSPTLVKLNSKVKEVVKKVGPSTLVTLIIIVAVTTQQLCQPCDATTSKLIKHSQDGSTHVVPPHAVLHPVHQQAMEISRLGQAGHGH